MNISDINRLIWNIDDEANILDFRLPNGISYWLLHRNAVYRFLLDRSAPEAAKAPALTNFSSGLKRKWDYWKYTRSSYARDPKKIHRHFDCLNICSNVATVPTAQGYRSRISGFLNDIASLSTNHVIISVNQRYQKKYEGHYSFFDAILLDANKSKQEISAAQQEVIRNFIRMLQKHIADIGAEQQESFFNQLLFLTSIAAPIEKAFQQFLERTTPSLVIVEDGNYGGIIQNSVIKAARDMNITTAEIQHGVFDVAFQYSDKMIGRRELARHKTDYVLTFGDYFTDFIHSSSKNISIGNYYLEEKKKSVGVQQSKSAKPVILFITQLDYTNEIIPVLYNALRLSKQEYELIIRIHPSDAGSKEKYNSLFEFAGTGFSTTEDLYAQLNSADYIIGSYSTVLYEAIFFDKLPFIHQNVLSNQFMPKQLGKTFGTAEELCRLLEQPVPKEAITHMKEYFWKEGTVANFKQFLEVKN